jgi:hypothetical protein
MSVISFAQAKELTLARLREWLNSLPAAERTRPRKIINYKPYSVTDLIREVERESTVGKEIVYDEVKKLGYAVE